MDFGLTTKFLTNKMVDNLFYSKILLSGEYVIFLGAKAFTIPYKKYFGKLEFISNESLANNSKKASKAKGK